MLWQFLSDNAGPISAGGIILGGLFKLWDAIKKKLDAQDQSRANEFASLRTEIRDVDKKNQERHEVNVAKFGDIRVALAVLGYRNGGTGHVVEHTPPPAKDG